MRALKAEQNAVHDGDDVDDDDDHDDVLDWSTQKRDPIMRRPRPGIGFFVVVGVPVAGFVSDNAKSCMIIRDRRAAEMCL